MNRSSESQYELLPPDELYHLLVPQNAEVSAVPSKREDYERNFAVSRSNSVEQHQRAPRSVAQNVQAIERAVAMQALEGEEKSAAGSQNRAEEMQGQNLKNDQEEVHNQKEEQDRSTNQEVSIEKQDLTEETLNTMIESLESAPRLPPVFKERKKPLLRVDTSLWDSRRQRKLEREKQRVAQQQGIKRIEQWRLETAKLTNEHAVLDPKHVETWVTGHDLHLTTGSIEGLKTRLASEQGTASPGLRISDPSNTVQEADSSSRTMVIALSEPNDKNSDTVSPTHRIPRKSVPQHDGPITSVSEPRGQFPAKALKLLGLDSAETIDVAVSSRIKFADDEPGAIRPLRKTQRPRAFSCGASTVQSPFPRRPDVFERPSAWMSPSLPTDIMVTSQLSGLETIEEIETPKEASLTAGTSSVTAMSSQPVYQINIATTVTIDKESQFSRSLISGALGSTRCALFIQYPGNLKARRVLGLTA